MNNKMFCLTNNEDNLTQLWKLDELELCKEYPD